MKNVRSLLVFASLAVIGVCISSVRAAEYPGDVTGAWDREYKELAQGIKSRPTSENPAASALLDKNCRILSGDKSPAGIVIRRTGALIAHLKTLPGAAGLRNFQPKLDTLKKKLSGGASDKEVYTEACKLRRSVVMANPLLDFDSMVFVTKRGNREGVLQCWDYGYGVSSGGGLYKVSGLKSGKPVIQDMLKNAVVPSGRLKGKKLSGGAFNIPALSYDGKTVAFSFVEKCGLRINWPRDVFEAFTNETCFHLFKIGADGSNLVQLTDGRRNDYHPAFLPNGRIVFVSDRRNIMDRCQTGRAFREFSQACGTMHSIKADGSDLIRISYHETTELFPAVDNNGMLVYTRWDYVDRDFSAAHGFWICYPDGRDPRAPHGNYALPHHTFDGKWKDGRADRPWAEYGIKPIPGSRRYVAIAGKHHISTPRGELVLIDLGIEDDNKMSQVTRFGDYALMDEASGYHGDMDKGLRSSAGYTDPWALSEDYMLAAQGSAVWLMDKFGNREILFSATKDSCNGISDIRAPIPLRARKAPPAIPTMTYQGQRHKAPGHKRATISVMNVYEADFKWPEKTKIKSLRIMQIFPFPWHSPWQDQPRVGPGSGVSTRAVLGVVPVEDDGSAYFEAPVGKAIYFQALNEHGMAVQSMRSCTYVHPGENLSCVGCHEKKLQVRKPGKIPAAMKRAPSKLTPNLEDGSCPLTYARLVEPLLKSKCIPCHTKKKKPAPDLNKYKFFYHGTGGHSGVQPMHGGYRSIAGRFGAIKTGLAKIMLKKHHREALTMAEINRVTLYIDANSNELGAYYDEAGQRAGKVVWPLVDMDPENPAGLDLFKGGKPEPTPSASTPTMKKNEAQILKLFPKDKWPSGGGRRRTAVKSKPVSFGKAVQQFAPGWKLSNCGNIESPGLRSVWAGKKNVLATHPAGRNTGSVLTRKLAVPSGKGSILRLVVGHDHRGDWTLIARINKKELIRKTIGKSGSKGGWMTVDVDLSKYAGKTVDIELVNQPSGWAYETAFWGEISLASK
jgi:hypothetical protein